LHESATNYKQLSLSNARDLVCVLAKREKRSKATAMTLRNATWAAWLGGFFISVNKKGREVGYRAMASRRGKRLPAVRTKIASFCVKLSSALINSEL